MNGLAIGSVIDGPELQCDWRRHLGFVDVDCYLKIFELALFGGRRPAGEA